MNYLARLRAEISGERHPSELTKPTNGPSVSFVSTPSRHVSRIERINAPLLDPATETLRQRELSNPSPNAPEVFSLSPPDDPTNDDEALQERVAIMMEGNGWNEATALLEARWDARRERCWRGFLRNAQRVLEAPAAHREGLLALYQTEASRRYGKAAGEIMTSELRGWVMARAVH